MAGNVDDLINKIKTEGFVAAEEKAQALEADARKKADEIITQARQSADQIIHQARAEASRMDAATRASLEQAARNVLLSLRQDILDLLKKLLARDLAEIISGDRLTGLVETVARNAAMGAQVTLNAADFDRLKDVCLSRLQQETKQGITFASRNARTKGLTISFDSNKSCFDLTEDSLAEYFMSFVNDEIGALLKK